MSQHRGRQLSGARFVPVLPGTPWVSGLQLVFSHPSLWYPGSQPALTAHSRGFQPLHSLDISLGLPCLSGPSSLCTLLGFGKLLTCLILFPALAPPSAGATLLRTDGRASPCSAELLRGPVLPSTLRPYPGEGGPYPAFLSLPLSLSLRLSSASSLATTDSAITMCSSDICCWKHQL